MRRRLALAEKLRITSPCDASWQTMQESDAHRRFCTSCDRHVHDASTLTRREVEALLRARAEGERICFHLHVRRSDGAILLADGHAMPPAGALRASLAVVAAAGALAACASPQQATAVPHGSIEIPNQPAPPAATVVTPAPIATVEPPLAMPTAEPPTEEPIPPLPPAEPPKPVKPSKPSTVKAATPVKHGPAHPPPNKKQPPIYDQIDGGVE